MSDEIEREWDGFNFKEAVLGGDADFILITQKDYDHFMKLEVENADLDHDLNSLIESNINTIKELENLKKENKELKEYKTQHLNYLFNGELKRLKKLDENVKNNIAELKTFFSYDFAEMEAHINQIKLLESLLND